MALQGFAPRKKSPPSPHLRPVFSLFQYRFAHISPERNRAAVGRPMDAGSLAGKAIRSVVLASRVLRAFHRNAHGCLPARRGPFSADCSGFFQPKAAMLHETRRPDASAAIQYGNRTHGKGGHVRLSCDQSSALLPAAGKRRSHPDVVGELRHASAPYGTVRSEGRVLHGPEQVKRSSGKPATPTPERLACCRSQPRPR